MSLSSRRYELGPTYRNRAFLPSSFQFISSQAKQNPRVWVREAAAALFPIPIAMLPIEAAPSSDEEEMGVLSDWTMTEEEEEETDVFTDWAMEETAVFPDWAMLDRMGRTHCHKDL